MKPFAYLCTGISVLLGMMCLTQCTQPVDTKTEISESNYLKEDSILWAQYEVCNEELLQKFQKDSISEDSLHKAWEKLYQKASRKNIELALEYVTVPSGLQRLYMVRNEVPKERLTEKLSILPDSLQENKYAQYIRKYIKTSQKKVGDIFEPFECVCPDGESFNWNRLKGKHVLLIFDGLYCMGKNGRDYLEDMLRKTNSNQLEVIVYLKCKNMDRLKEEAEKFPKFKLISDFQPEGSPMNILYKCQASPTCFMIDQQGKIHFISEGLAPEKFKSYLQSNGCYE